MSGSASTVALRLRGRALVVERRTLVLSGVFAVVILLLGFAGLSYGSTWSSPGEVLAALVGTDPSVVILEWRLPRVVAAIVFGAALGVAGAIFQNITRNPMGSPDVIGLDAGAYTGTLVAMTLLASSSVQLAFSSVVGGLVAATVVYLLSRSNGLSGLRLVVIGIAVNAMVTALNSWLVLRAELEVAIAAVGWSSGSLNGIDWADVAVPFTVIGVLLVAMALVVQSMHQSALGDAVAVATGVGLDRLRLLLVLIGVGCTATVTAVAGPIVFIALAAPQIGRRLARAPGIAVLPAALTGAVLLQTADLLAQLLLAPVSLPVGVVTTAIGGGYLMWLLAQEVRRR
ncbi:FecCD family ABC transporter permease [Saccharomonospora azurea]|uniref:ABC-type enterobactin transport system, permease component n=1 Tax=Saccharomonospora azurea NA-128 TaxID=882081 RepID=H8GC57_9PSEU|nr:iron chelate uptake ABC transporter family permease subunit [Saccharomonospora azurea]EHK80215.1 transporter permease [Saccharomonospora azurea SZMC 14600]EHK87424.1 transporter permease [Saccharomonospora azurea SZMC 14600]EHY87734.1 ABC-type enterobactin transport system, permease component [Saccharomonospora azurea NA-128]